MIKKKRKTKSLRKLVDDVAVALQKHVRLKAADDNGYCKCWYCGQKAHWKEMDGCHHVSRTHQATKLVEENIHPGHKGCNLRAGKGDTLKMIEYRNNMIDFYGEDFVIELEASARHPKKHDRVELENMLVDLRRRNKELEDEL